MVKSRPEGIFELDNVPGRIVMCRRAEESQSRPMLTSISRTRERRQKLPRIDVLVDVPFRVDGPPALFFLSVGSPVRVLKPSGPAFREVESGGHQEASGEQMPPAGAGLRGQGDRGL